MINLTLCDYHAKYKTRYLLYLQVLASQANQQSPTVHHVSTIKFVLHLCYPATGTHVETVSLSGAKMEIQQIVQSKISLSYDSS